MLQWHEHSVPNKVIVIALAVVGGYVFLVDSENDNAKLLMVALFATAFVYHLVDDSRARRKYKKTLEVAAQKQPLLATAPETIQSGDIPNADQFTVYDIESGDELGKLAGQQLRELVQFHEECGMESNDFYILAETPTMLEELGKSKLVAAILIKWLNDRDSMQIRWVRNNR